VAERNAQPQKDPKKSTKFQKEGYAQPGKWSNLQYLVDFEQNTLNC
jgi:hypothetical protein